LEPTAPPAAGLWLTSSVRQKETMQPPPDEIDGAKVLAWSLLDARHRKTDTVRLYDGETEQLSFAGVVLARYEDKPSVIYAFYCDGNWSTLNDSDYSTFEEAKDSAERLFIGLKHTWRENGT
jgi:hypothetical protein